MKKMLIEVITGEPEEVFVEDTEIAYKDGEIYDIFVSQKTFLAGSLLGKMRVVVDQTGSILQWIYPMMSAGEYQILNKKKIESYRKIVETYDEKNL